MTVEQKSGTPNQNRGTFRRRERGSSLVEQALILTFLLSMLFAIIDFGRAMYTYHFVSNAAREASRWASVRGITTSLPGGAASPASVRALVKDVTGMGLDPAKITVDTSWVPPPNNSPACTQNIKNPGCVVQVSVTYSYKFFFPFLPTSPITMQSTSQMVISQ
jgi:Flp pilus assembly protein TadG